MTLDEDSIGRSSSDIEHERATAIYDLIEENSFAPVGHDDGPYALHLGIKENRLVLDIRRDERQAGDRASALAHAVQAHRQRLFHDLRQLLRRHPHRDARPIEAIDMGRRGLHDEGSRILQDAIKRKVKVDFDTARRLFTLICVLHWKG